MNLSKSARSETLLYAVASGYRTIWAITVLRKITKKPRNFFAKACDGNNYKTCSNLGFMYSNAQGVARDYDKAAELYIKACEGGDVFGCQNVGAMYLKGEGVKSRRRKRARLYKNSLR